MNLALASFAPVDTPPPLLYKYLGPDRMDVLNAAMLRFSPPDAFNDPFEDQSSFFAEDAGGIYSSDAVRAVETVAFKDLPSSSLSVKMLEHFSDVFRKWAPTETERLLELIQSRAQVERVELDPNKVLGILCLREGIDDVLMWSHYAAGHTGFAIGLDTNSQFFSQELVGGKYLSKVRYLENLAPSKELDSSTVRQYLIKHTRWKYEKEWRAFSPLSGATKIHDAPQSQIHLFSLPRTAVSRIVLGATSSPKLAAEIRDILSSHPEYSATRIFKANTTSGNLCLHEIDA